MPMLRSGMIRCRVQGPAAVLEEQGQELAAGGAVILPVLSLHHYLKQNYQHSLSVHIARHLLETGREVQQFDPHAAARQELRQ